MMDNNLTEIALTCMKFQYTVKSPTAAHLSYPQLSGSGGQDSRLGESIGRPKAVGSWVLSGLM